MSEFWRKWKQPWTRSQAGKRYVEGQDDASLKAIAAESGISKRSLETWSKQDNWVEQRKAFGGRVAVATNEKLIEKTSEKLGDELSDVAIANYKVHKLARDYVMAIFQIKALHMQSILHADASQQLELLKLHNAHEMNSWSLILTRATEGINQATGLSYYVNIDTAAKKLNSVGYLVTENTEESQ